MNFKYLKLNLTKEGIAKIFFSNPKNKNAFNPSMINDIKEAISFLKRSEKCRLLILSGEGNIFSSGADLEWMKKSKNLNFKQNKQEAKNFTEMLKDIDNFPKPTISFINGHAFGGALGIIAVSDFSLSIESSKFCFSEVKLGLIPAMIAPYILRSIGYNATKKLFLTGEVFGAKKALSFGLIDAVVKNSYFKNNDTMLIQNLLSAAPIAQRKIKSFIKEVSFKKIDTMLINKTAETISKIRVTKEAQEGLSAFLEKRKPNWNKN